MKTFLRFMVITTFAIVGFLTLNSFTNFMASDDGVKTVVAGAYSVEYSEVYKQPLRVEYMVRCAVPKLDRKGMRFKKSPWGIKTSSDEDYKNNVWDKGHLAPSATFACNEDRFKQVYYWENCALQHEALNRGPWKEVEEFERDLAKVYDTVAVTIKVDVNEFSDVLPTGTSIPDGFRRHIHFGDQDIWLYFPNDSTVAGKDWSRFKTKLRR